MWQYLSNLFFIRFFICDKVIYSFVRPETLLDKEIVLRQKLSHPTQFVLKTSFNIEEIEKNYQL